MPTRQKPRKLDEEDKLSVEDALSSLDTADVEDGKVTVVGEDGKRHKIDINVEVDRSD
jgi:hypothetical protein